MSNYGHMIQYVVQTQLGRDSLAPMESKEDKMGNRNVSTP